MVKSQPNRKATSIILLVFTLGIILFFAGLVAGRISAQYTLTIDPLDAGELAAESAALEFALIQDFDTQTCSHLDARQSALSAQLAQIGRTLSQPDIKDTLHDDEYDMLKRRYHLMQAKAYIQIRQLKNLCNKTHPVILFFYDDPQTAQQESMNPDYYKLSQKQGWELDAIVKRLGEQNISVFAMEYQYAPELGFIENFYSISTAPALIVDYRYKIGRYATQEEILKYLNIPG
ncbi:MAG: hypothetical protein ACOCWQ_04180 [Nanoarchaeota archaeon]